MASDFNWADFAKNLYQQQKNARTEWTPTSASSTPSVASLDYGMGNTYATYSQNQSAQMSQSLDKAASTIGQAPGGFGQGFTYGYQGAKVLTAGILNYRAAKYNKQILGMQAELSDLQAKAYQTAAEDVLRAGNQQVAAITYQHGQVRSATRVAQASSGVRIGGAGSAAEVLASQAIVTEMQVNQTLANAVTESFGYQRKKTQQKMNSIAVRSAQKGISPWASAIIGTLSAASDAAPAVASAYMGGQGGGATSAVGNHAPGN